MTTQSQQYNCCVRNGGNAIPKHAGPEAKGSNPTAGVTLLWPVTHSGEILTTGKSHGKKPDRFSLNDDRGVKNVSRFEYAAWNIRGLGVTEEELDKILERQNYRNKNENTNGDT